jgi:hypothetical protein
MSFRYGVNDVLALIQLSWSAVEGATRACGKHDDLTKEISSLYDVLAHVYSELSLPESSIGQARSSWKTELESHLTECDTQLRIINTVLEKFNSLSYEHKVGKQLWSTVRFANGDDQDLAEIRSRIATYSTAITMSLRLMSLASRGKVERQLNREKGSLVGIRQSVNLALAQINSTTRHKSLIIAYSNDPKAFWSRLRRELTKDGFSRSALNNKKDLVISYMKELDSRGVLGYSTSFQKAMKAQPDAKRQSTTPASFQSSSTLTGGRNSNFSLHSYESLKDSGYCSSTLEEPICIRAESGDPSWPESRPVTAVEQVQVSEYAPYVIRVESNDQYKKSPSPSIPYRVRHEPESAFPARIVTDGPVNMPTQQPTMHNHSHYGAHRSTIDVEAKIKLEDPMGREFSFPLAQAKTWEVRTPTSNPLNHLTYNREWKA